MSLVFQFSRRGLMASTVALTMLTMWPRLAASDAAITPEISISLRSVSSRTIEVGEPLFIAVRIERPEESSATIELAPVSGGWSDAVEVGIVGVDGGALRFRAQSALRDETASATLDAERVVGGIWFVASSATAQLAPGNYFVRARLAIRDGTGWKGESSSESISLRVVAAGSDAAGRGLQRTIARAQEAVLADAPEDAARLLDAQLTAYPDNVRLLTARAALCVRGDDYRSAMICVNRAMNRVAQENRPHPPSDLFELENQIAAAMEAAGGARSAPPEWTRLPATVLAPILEERAPAQSSTTAIPVAMVPVAPVQSNGPGVNSAAVVTAAEVAKPNPPAAASVGPGSVVPSVELVDAKIIADAAGQWATNATAGSQYGRTQYSAAQATGAPNVPVAGNSPDAWCPAVRDKGMDWLEVTFANPVHATEVRVRQNDAPGALAKIEAIEPDGTAHVWWEGVDPYQRTEVREIVWFAVRVPRTAYQVARVKLTLNLASGPGYKEIDAVQLVGAAQ